MVGILFIVNSVVSKGFVIGPCFVMQYLLSFLFCNYLAEEERAGCFTLIAFLLPCGCYCSLSLPHSAVLGLQCVIVAFSCHTRLLLDFRYARA